MKNTLLTAFVTLLLASCGDKDSSEDKDSKTADQKETAQDTTAHNDSTLALEDSVVVEEKEYINFSEDFRSGLESHFSKNEVDSLQKWAHQAQNLKTDEDLLKWYGQLHAKSSLFEETLMDIADKNEPYDVIEQIGGWEQQEFNGLLLTCVAECTELEFTLNNRVLDSLAKMTEGTKDDDFVALCLMSEESYGHLTEYGFKKWFMMTWDYGGSSLIGDSSAYEFLVAYDKYLAQYGESKLTNLLGNVRTNALEMAAGYRSYMFTVPKIKAELEMILKDIKLSDEEKEAINARLEELNDPKANDLDVDCENVNCPYG